MPFIYEARTMGRVVATLPPVNTFFRSTFFNKTETFVTKSVDVDFVKGSRKIAPFVSRAIGGKVVPNTGYTTKTYVPPLVAPEKVTTADELLYREPGESIISGKTPADRAIDKMAADFIDLRDQITRREEQMCASAITTGTIPVIGEGVNEIIDFGFTNKVKLADAKKWSQADTNPLTDIKAWHKQVQKSGFVNCDVAIMSDDVADALTSNANVQKLLDTKNYDLAVIAPKQLPNGVTYIGSIKGLGLDLYTYNEWYLDDWTNPLKPEEKPLIPDGTFVLMSTRAQYSMYYGAITVIDDASKEFRTVEGEYVPDTYIARKPARRFLNLSSAPLPVPHEVDSWFVATVL